MGCMKAVGAVGGGALGYALAPATGGSSLLLSTALGASAGGMLGSSIDASQAAKEAGKLQAKAAGEATDTQLEMYLKSREDLAPWRAAGERALNPLIEMAEKGPGEFIPEDQPGYKFGYKEFVEKPLLQRASAMGKLRSGETMRALSDRASDYASTSYDNWINRWLTRMQPLQSIAGMGQRAAGQTGQFGTQTGQGIAGNLLAGARGQAEGKINQANAWTGLFKGATNTLLDAAVLNKTGGGGLFGNAGYSYPTITSNSPGGGLGSEYSDLMY